MKNPPKRWVFSYKKVFIQYESFNFKSAIRSFKKNG